MSGGRQKKRTLREGPTRSAERDSWLDQKKKGPQTQTSHFLLLLPPPPPHAPFVFSSVFVRLVRRTSFSSC